MNYQQYYGQSNGVAPRPTDKHPSPMFAPGGPYSQLSRLQQYKMLPTPGPGGQLAAPGQGIPQAYPTQQQQQPQLPAYPQQSLYGNQGGYGGYGQQPPQSLAMRAVHQSQLGTPYGIGMGGQFGGGQGGQGVYGGQQLTAQQMWMRKRRPGLPVYGGPPRLGDWQQQEQQPNQQFQQMTTYGGY